MLIKDARMQTLKATVNKRKLKDQESDNGKIVLSYRVVKAQYVLEWQRLKKRIMK